MIEKNLFWIDIEIRIHKNIDSLISKLDLFNHQNLKLPSYLFTFIIPWTLFFLSCTKGPCKYSMWNSSIVHFHFASRIPLPHCIFAHVKTVNKHLPYRCIAFIYRHCSFCIFTSLLTYWANVGHHISCNLMWKYGHKKQRQLLLCAHAWSIHNEIRREEKECCCWAHLI